MKRSSNVLMTISLLVLLILTLTVSALPYDKSDIFKRLSNSNTGQPPQSGLSISPDNELTLSYANSFYWGWVQDVVASGNYAYCATNNGLMILDLSSPPTTAVVSQVYVPGFNVWHLDIGGRERSIVLDGDYAYMTCQGMGLRVFDVSTPASPVLVGSIDEFDDSNPFWDIKISGNYAYIAAEKGLVIINISDPTDPLVAGREITSYGVNLTISGNIVYMGNGGQTEVIDVTLPGSPVKLTPIEAPAVDVCISGSHPTWLYCISSDGNVIVVDISTPGTPAISDTLVTSQALGAAFAVGNFLYLGGQGDPVGFAYGFDSVGVYSLSNPAAPSLLDKFGATFGSNVNISVFPPYAYFAAYDGMHEMDISGSPSYSQGYQPYQIDRISISGDYSYFVSLDTFYISDLTVPTEPTVVGLCETGSYSNVLEIEIVGDNAFILLQNDNVKIIDISDPNSPSNVGTIYGSFSDIAVVDTLVYAVKKDTLEIYNVAAPASPTFLGGTTTKGLFYRAIEISGNYAFVAVEDLSVVAGMQVFDISDPTDPMADGDYILESGEDPIQDIKIRGNYAYVIGLWEVIDISDPTSPFADNLMPAYSYGVSREIIAGNYLIFVNNNELYPVLEIADISDPANPVMLVSETTLGFPQDAAIYGNYLYTTEVTGLVIREMAFILTSNPIVVTNLLDSGIGSLRWAINLANNSSGADSISFSVSGTILLQSPLPAFTDDLIHIHGSTAPGGERSVIIDGNSGSVTGLEIQSSHNFIEGLIISNHSGYQVIINGDTNSIEGCFLNVNSDGVTSGTWGGGLSIKTGAVGNVIGGCSELDGNVATGGGGFPGIYIEGNDNFILGNLAGVTADGMDFFPDCNVGILCLGDSNQIGGGADVCRNVVYGATACIQIAGKGNTAINNFVGLDITGLNNLYSLTPPNHGIHLFASTNCNIGTNNGGGNYISGVEQGVYIGIDCYNNSIMGNFIGTDTTGKSGLGGIDMGISISGGGNRIGDTLPGFKNLIGSCSQGGIVIRGGDTNRVIGNYIGLGLEGEAMGNLFGILFFVEKFPDNNLIMKNIIAYNIADGIGSYDNTGSGNTFSQNLIFDNGGLAIDLGIDDGVTLNDPADADSGQNNLLNYPEIDSINSQEDGTYVIYGTAPIYGIVEIFVAHPADDSLKPADSSGHGEAYRFLGSATASAIGQFNMPTDTFVKHFSILSTTATDTMGNTSEMSVNFVLLPRPMTVTSYGQVNIIITDPDGIRFGLESDGTPIEEIANAEYFNNPFAPQISDSCIIYYPIPGEYTIEFVPDFGKYPMTSYSAAIRIDGTQQFWWVVNQDVPAAGTSDSFNYSYEEGYAYENGDANGDDAPNVGDAVFLINYVFKGGPAPDPLLAGDANCDAGVNVGDAVYIINYVFKGGPEPCDFTL